MKTSRRDFIKNTSLASTTLAAFPIVLKAGLSANEKIKVGLIGCNGMGFTNLQTFLNQPNVECAALCDVDQNVLEKRAREVELIQNKKPAIFSDFRKLLDKKDIDVIINATPDHWHALIAIYSLQANKHLYTEKPLANSIEECKVMVAAQKRYKKVVQVGQWQKSEPHWKSALNYVNSGYFGKIQSVRAWTYLKTEKPIIRNNNFNKPKGVDYNFWLGPAPESTFNPHRFHSNFKWFWNFGSGIMADNGGHLVDAALKGVNKTIPKSVMATGGNFTFSKKVMETPDTFMAMFDFGDVNFLWDHSVGTSTMNFNRKQGIAFIGSSEKVIVDNNGWEIIPAEDEKRTAKRFFKSRENGLDLHVANFLDCVKFGGQPNCDIETAANIASITQMANISYRLGRKVFWNEANQSFENDAEANNLAAVHYRSPWKLPLI